MTWFLVLSIIGNYGPAMAVVPQSSQVQCEQNMWDYNEKKIGGSYYYFAACVKG